MLLIGISDLIAAESISLLSKRSNTKDERNTRDYDDQYLGPTVLKYCQDSRHMLVIEELLD